MYRNQTFKSSKSELAVWQPWTITGQSKNYRPALGGYSRLGDVNSILATLTPDTSSFSLDPTMLYVGLGLLGLAAVLFYGRRGVRGYKSLKGKRRKRKARIGAARAQLQAARAS